MPLLPKLALSRVFSLKHQKLFLTRKIMDFLHLGLQPMRKICGVKSIRKGQGKAMLPIILSLLSHNLTRKLIFFQKRVT